MNKNQKASDLKTAKGLGSKVNHSIQTSISKEEFKAGDVSDKIAVPLSDGKTVVFAKTPEDVERLRKKWNKILGLNR